MELTVNINNVLTKQIDQIESGEYNVTECNFIFSSEYDNLTKKAVFTGEDGTAYLETIIDNNCSIPSEILEVSQVVEIGVYAYSVDGEELILRYSPEPTQFYIHQGSYKEASNSTPPTPTEIEQLQAQITTNANDIDTLEQTTSEQATDISNLQSDVSDIKSEQITQNDNIQTNSNNIQTINQDIDNLEQTKADKTEIPTKTSDLINNSNFVSDANYVHTDNNFTDEYKNQITTNKNDIADIKAEQITQNTDIQNNTNAIGQEVTDRQNADVNLQNQIDAITVSSDVIDVLGTYQDLLNYDTTHVKANDIIKVLQDSTHNDAISYYRWIITDHVGAWVYVGSEGPYYTKGETDTLLNNKANADDVYTKTQTYSKTEVDTTLTDYVKNTDYATESKGGVVKINGYFDATLSNSGQLYALDRTYSFYTNTSPRSAFISKGTLENVITGKNLETANNKVTSISSSSTDTQYPSAKCVYDLVGDIESILEELDVGGGVV